MLRVDSTKGIPHGSQADSMIDRRAFVCFLLASVAAAPPLARAQNSAKVRRIGLLSQLRGPNKEEIQGLVEPLRELGWIEGRNIVIESRFAKGKLDQLRPLADELVRLDVEMIVTYGSPAALAAKSATTSIPIVMGSVGDPVAMGLVASLAHPGGNMTGYSIVAPEIYAKTAGLVHEMLPTVERVAVIVPPKGFSSITDLLRKATDVAYRSLGVQSIFIEVPPSGGNLESEQVEVVREAVRRRAQAVDIPGGNIGPFIKAAMGYRLPVITHDRATLEMGALLSLEVNEEDRRRRVAAIIDKIFRGAKPGEIPIEQPTKFTLLINMKTAGALGISVPQSLLHRADEVIR